MSVMYDDPMRHPEKFMVQKRRALGTKGKPFDLMNSKLVDNIDGSTDLVQVITPMYGDVYLCEKCVKRLASTEGLVLEPVVFSLSGKCMLCGRPIWAVLSRGERAFRVRRIQLSLSHVWKLLGGQKSRAAKYAGSRLW